MNASAKIYWEKRLNENFNLKGVGYYKAGNIYNYWIYRMRKKVFLKQFNKILREKANPDILEIGPGSGFYTDMLLQKGIDKLWLCDLTEVAANNLAKKYPTVHAYTNDIGSKHFSIPKKKFDIILCMDVLFHITTDEAYSRSFQNMKEYLQDDGVLIFTENMSPNYQHRGHIVDRTATELTRLLKTSHLTTTYSKPMFYFLNPPVNQTNSLLWKLSNMRVSVLAFFEKISLGFINHIFGFLVYALDSFLHFTGANGFGTNMIICRVDRETKSDSVYTGLNDL